MAPRSLEWRWADAGRCALCAIPAALVILSGDPTKGLAWTIGILPAAMVGMAPKRRDRTKVILIGLLFAISVIVGSVLSQAALLAVVGIFFVAYGSALLASRVAFGQVAMMMCAPVAAIGLSYPDLGEAFGLGLLMLGGSVWSCAVLLVWPEGTATSVTRPPLLSPAFARRYGVLLGLAAASCAAVGEAIHTDHVGWPTAAAMFVMRPAQEMQELRSIGRIASVFLGALAAVAFLRADPSLSAVAGAAMVDIAGAGATRESRWYVAPFFTTFLVLTLLLYADRTVAHEQWRFEERVGLTVLGVAIGYFFGLVIPRVMEAVTKRRLAAG